MSTEIDLRPVLEFLSELGKNNDRAWFASNRAAYQAAQERFEAFVELIIGEVGAFVDLAGVTPEDCIFRIHRDIRFSKDKSPYKTHMAAAIAPGGRKFSGPLYYVHVEPDDGSLVAGGLHTPSPEQIARFREAIDRDAGPFKAIIGGEEFKRLFGALDSEKLKTAPQGYARNHPEIDLLRLKEVLAFHRIPDEVVLSPDFPDRVVDAWLALKPLVDYLNETVRES
jgi:uncharacterized protein (TIGR02453 family)